jgi:hydroxypyruvate reductase
MARAIVAWLSRHGRSPDGGIVIAAELLAPLHPSVMALVGDHPVPGDRSARAAAAMAEIFARIPLHAEVHVAISGGASALMAGALPSLSTGDVSRTFELLMSSGLDIREMNAVRKRVTRWSAGRLALALAPRTLHIWVISDVIGDDPGSIGSGPCTGDAWTSNETIAMLAGRGLFDALPYAVKEAMRQETPKPDDPFLRSITPRIVANNGTALAAAVAAARQLGIEAQIMPNPLRGDAAAMGREIANGIRDDGTAPRLRIWGGETMVTIAGNGGVGGRSQELALAAAELLHGRGGVLLAAGTDGRDGPTDAAGALVDGATWTRIEAAGRDPSADLLRHDSHAALNAAGALIKTGPSGTNVCDIAIGASGWG